MATDAPTISGATARRIPKKKIRWGDAIFHGLLILAVALALGALAWLFGSILVKGVGQLDWSFITSGPSSDAAKAGFYSGIRGSLVLIFWGAVVALPLGFAAAIYLEKFAATTQAELRSWLYSVERRHSDAVATGRNRPLGALGVLAARVWTRVGPTINRIVDVNISNLAAVPSIIYGLLGLTVFITFVGFDKALLAGGLTIGVLVLPIVIIAAREAIRAVPSSIEQGAMALGATKFRAVTRLTLPAAIPGMLTGTILAISRAIGETAPLIVVGGAFFSTTIPSINPLAANEQPLLVMPFQIFQWQGDARDEFQALAPAGIIVLMVVLILLNSAAIFLRNKYSRRW